MRIFQFLSLTAAFGASTCFCNAQGAHLAVATLYNSGSFGSLSYSTTGALYGASEGGAVFELIPPASPGGAWTQNVLHTFAGGSDGLYPFSGPVLAKSGKLYGTTQEGGPMGLGVVYALTPPPTPGGTWKETVLYSFQGGSDGSYPFAGVVIGKSGVLYGTTSVGGDAGTPAGCFGLGCGVVFALTPPTAPGTPWTETVLYRFTGGIDGGSPSASLVIGSHGELYGTTEYGGASNAGTVFELTPPASPGGPWTQTVLYAFTGQAGDGNSPWAGVVVSKNGSLYGTTQTGGASNNGTVFRLTPPVTPGNAWTETVLYSFPGGIHGADPLGTLVIGKTGSLFGTTLNFGASKSCSGFNCGTVFALKPPTVPGGAWSEVVLHSFSGGSDGAGSWAGLTIGTDGTLYGTTSVGGPSNAGTVFALAQ